MSFPYSFTNPTQFQSLTYGNATERVNGYQLITGSSPLTIRSPSPISQTIDQGGAATINSGQIVNGTSPYSYQWYEQIPGSISYSPIPGATTSDYILSTSDASTTGIYDFKVNITDSSSNHQNSGIGISSPAAILLNPVLTTSLSATSPIDSGQSTAIEFTISGGTGPYTLSWTGIGASSTCPTSEITTGTYTCTDSPSASTSYTVKVTDSASSSVSATAPVTVNPLPTVSISSVNPIIVDIGQPVTVTASAVSGGTGASTYSWAVAAGDSCPGFTSVSGSSFIYTPSGATPNCEFTVTVTDTVDGTGTATTGTITVNPLLTVTVQPNTPTVLDIGQPLSVNAIAAGGSGTYTYTWTTTGTCSGFNNPASSNSFIYTPTSSTAGCKFNLQITDSLSGSNTVSTAQITVNPLLEITTQPNTLTTLDIGQSISINAIATGGSGSYTYSWIATGCPSLTSGSGNILTYTPKETSKSCAFTFTENDGLTTNTASTMQIAVNTELVTPTLQLSNTLLDSGQYETLTATENKGTPPYTFTFYNTTSGNAVAILGCSMIQTNTCSFKTTSYVKSNVFSYNVLLADNATIPELTNSITQSATVNAAPIALITFSNTLLDSGQEETVTLTTIGGTGLFTANLINITGNDGQEQSNIIISTIGGSNSVSFIATSPTNYNSFTYSWNALDYGTTANYPFNSQYSTFMVNVPLTTPTLTTNPTFPVTWAAGNTVAFTASFSGGTSPYTYNYQIVNIITGNILANYLITNSSTSNTFLWIIPNKDIGNTIVANVIVTDSASTRVTVNSVYTNTLTVIYTPPIVTISPLSNTIALGQSQTLTATILNGANPYTYNWQVFNSIGLAFSTLYTNNDYTQNTFTFTPLTTETYYANVIISDAYSTTTTSENSVITVIASTTTSTTTTIPQSSGGGGGGSSGGGGGGGGGGSGGSFLPSTINYVNGNQTGYEITNLSQLNSETLHLNNGTKIIKLTINFITPTSAGITINNQSFTLKPNSPVAIVDPNNYTYYTELKNISYLPIAQTIILLVYGQPNMPTAITSTSTTQSTSTTTSIPATAPQHTPVQQPPATVETTIIQQTKSNNQINSSDSTNKNNYLIAGSIVVVVLILAGVSYSIKSKKKEQTNKKTKYSSIKSDKEKTISKKTSK